MISELFPCSRPQRDQDSHSEPPAIPSADLTSGQLKSGPAAEDIFRTLSTGLSGTPMPSFRVSLSEDDRWALAYYVVSLSAYKDPLTGEPLKISATDRAALNDPRVEARTAAHAYAPAGTSEVLTVRGD